MVQWHLVLHLCALEKLCLNASYLVEMVEKRISGPPQMRQVVIDNFLKADKKTSSV